MSPIRSTVFALIATVLGATTAVANTRDRGTTKTEPYEVCFNLYCTFKAKVPDSDTEARRTACKVAARFYKEVGADGTEIRDRSEYPDNPEFEVECDETLLFNNSAHRYTDHLGTRIQAQSGPFPALLLPTGALKDGHGYVTSVLDLGGEQMRGLCYVYTGPQ